MCGSYHEKVNFKKLFFLRGGKLDKNIISYDAYINIVRS